MTERQALKLSTLDDEARKGLSEMGFGDEQVEAAVLNCPGKGFAKALQWVMSSMGMSDPDSGGGDKIGTPKKRKSDATPKASKSSSSAPPKKASTGTTKKSKTAAAAQEEAASAKSGQVAEPRVDEDEGTLVDIEDEAPTSAPKPVVDKDVQRKAAKKVKREAGAGAAIKGDNAKSKQAGKSEVKTQQAAAGSGDKAANVEQKTSCVEPATSGKDGKASKKANASAGTSGSDPLPKKAKAVRVMDSHDLDPSWLGFVADKNPFVPPPGEHPFKDSSSLQIKSFEALERIQNNATMESPDQIARKRVAKGIHLPRSALKALVLDWTVVCEQKKLYKLPRDPNVAQILEQYQTSVEKFNKNGVVASDRLRYSVSIQEYFESYCRTHLLYDDRERRQYDRIIKDDRFDSCSDIYGAEHLLRLMSKLPDLLFGIPESNLKEFAWSHSDFMKFFEKNMPSLMERGEEVIGSL